MPRQKTVFDAAYADALYTEYKNRRTDDTAALAALRAAFEGKTVLVLAPGASLAAEVGRAAVAAAAADVTVSANFVPDFMRPDYAFFTNAKRFDEAAAYPCPLILTSNLRADKDAAVVNYDRLSATDAQGGNSVLMLLRLLRLCGAKAVLLAGADGYKAGCPRLCRQPAARPHRARCRVQHRHGRCHQSLRAGCDPLSPPANTQK